jgi:hypothetical protein
MSDLFLSVFSDGFYIPPIAIGTIELVIDANETYAGSRRRLVHLWVLFSQSIVIRQNSRRKKEQLRVHHCLFLCELDDASVLESIGRPKTMSTHVILVARVESCARKTGLAKCLTQQRSNRNPVSIASTMNR